MFLMVWKTADPAFAHSSANFRKIIAFSMIDAFTSTEHSQYDVIQRDDLTESDIRTYRGIDAGNHAGALLNADPQDAPHRMVAGVDTALTSQDMVNGK